MTTKITKEALETVSKLSAAQAAIKLGVSKTGVTEARQRYGMKRERVISPPSDSGKPSGKAASVDVNSDGSLLITTQDVIPQSKDNVEERMRARGFDPEQYVFTYGFSEWEAQTSDGIQTLYSARASATERKGKNEPETMGTEELIAFLDGYEPIRGEAADIQPSGTFVFCFADPQLGKVDQFGGTRETIARFRASIDHACAILDGHPAEKIIWADLGDGIENFCNTSSQRQTNDLNLVEQVRVLRRLQLEGIMRLLEYAPVVHVSVPSNHSMNRVGMQAPASTSHDDWGLEVQVQLSDILSGRTDLPNTITFLAPEAHMESVSHTTNDGTVVGFVHGHRSTNQNSLEQWWAGQALGNQPTANAKILLVGHFHNLSLRSVGDGRYLITTPSLDNGSSWFTQMRGHVATAGVLTLRVRDGVPTDLKIV